MTEREWLACTESDKMLRFIAGKVSERKLRLFAVACCRRVWRFVRDERYHAAVVICERYADGLATEQELEQAWVAAVCAGWPKAASKVLAERANAARQAMRDAASGKWEMKYWEEQGVRADPLVWAMSGTSSWAAEAVGWEALRVRQRASGRGVSREELQHAYRDANRAERMLHCHLLRDLVPSTQRLSVKPAWLTWKKGTIQKAAWRMYENRDFARLPSLADALEQAGCDNEAILLHCRAPGDHCRGCWAIDLLLGRASDADAPVFGPDCRPEEEALITTFRQAESAEDFDAALNAAVAYRKLTGKPIH